MFQSDTPTFLAYPLVTILLGIYYSDYHTNFCVQFLGVMRFGASFHVYKANSVQETQGCPNFCLIILL